MRGLRAGLQKLPEHVSVCLSWALLSCQDKAAAGRSSPEQNADGVNQPHRAVQEHP